MARGHKFSKEELYRATKNILLKHGYEGFSFGKVAERLQVSRSTLYKYFENKEVLITEYMIYEMKLFLIELQKINMYQGFQAQFDYLIHIIFKDSEIHQIRDIAFQVRAIHDEVKTNIKELEKLHQDMYRYLQSFVQLGKDEMLLKPTIADSIVLGIILQTVAIPNHFGVPQAEWIASIKEVISHGMFT